MQHSTHRNLSGKKNGADSHGHAFQDIPSDAYVDPPRRKPAAPDMEPESLRRKMPAAEPFPLGALGPVLSAAAKRIHEVMRAPVAMCGQSVLAAAALAAQRHADIEIDGRVYPLSLFQLTIAESGERKSHVDRASLAVHKVIERQKLERYEQELETWKEEAREWAAQEKKEGPKPDKPVPPHTIISTPTLEGMHKMYAEGAMDLGLFHDDGGEFFGGHAMSTDAKMKTASGMCRLWDDGSFDRVRAGDDASVGKYWARRLALYMQIQPVVAEGVLSDDVLLRQGLLARALLSWPESTIGTRKYVRADLTKDEAMQAYYDRMRELLEMKPAYVEDSSGEASRRRLTLSGDAYEAWVQMHDVLEERQLPGNDLFTVRPWASKAAEQVLRIAGTLALAEDPDATKVQEETVDRAYDLVQHYLTEAVRIVGTAGTPVKLKNAEALLEWCHKTGRTEICSESTMRLGPACIRNVHVFNAAMIELESAGWATPSPGRVIDGKKRKRAWLIREARA